MNFKLVKFSFYSLLASIFGTDVILPSWGCFSLYKKNKETDELLKSKKIELNDSTKALEEFKNKAIKNQELTRATGQQA